ncbi:MAG: anthranilate synthase component II, partial [Longimicrobiales bacterium]
MLLVIDNYDSFTYNLVQDLGALGADPVVHRNDEVTVDEVESLGPERVVISPGPCTPALAGISIELVRRLAERGTPLLGVCLGHQAIAEAFGGSAVRARRLMHGKPSPVGHGGVGLFNGLPDPFQAMRYHSLIVAPDPLPAELEIVAWTAEPGWEDEIQALRHRERPIWGVQFHPESVVSVGGRTLLRNFLEL